MKRLGVALLVAGGVLVVAVVAAGTIFYIKIYQPIASPLMAIAGAHTLEERRLQNQLEFVPPGSGEITDQQAASFVAVEEAVHKHLATGISVLNVASDEYSRIL